MSDVGRRIWAWSGLLQLLVTVLFAPINKAPNGYQNIDSVHHRCFIQIFENVFADINNINNYPNHPVFYHLTRKKNLTYDAARSTKAVHVRKRSSGVILEHRTEKDRECDGRNN